MDQQLEVQTKSSSGQQSLEEDHSLSPTYHVWRHTWKRPKPEASGFVFKKDLFVDIFETVFLCTGPSLKKRLLSVIRLLCLASQDDYDYGGDFIVYNRMPLKEICLALALLTLGTLGLVLGSYMAYYKVWGDRTHGMFVAGPKQTESIYHTS